MREEYICALSFNDYPNVIHLAKFLMDAKGVPLKIPLNHPRKNEVVFVHYRGTSKTGRKLYFFKEGNDVGEIRGG